MPRRGKEPGFDHIAVLHRTIVFSVSFWPEAAACARFRARARAAAVLCLKHARGARELWLHSQGAQGASGCRAVKGGPWDSRAGPQPSASAAPRWVLHQHLCWAAVSCVAVGVGLGRAARLWPPGASWPHSVGCSGALLGQVPVGSRWERAGRAAALPLQGAFRNVESLRRVGSDGNTNARAGAIAGEQKPFSKTEGRAAVNGALAAVPRSALALTGIHLSVTSSLCHPRVAWSCSPGGG